MSIFNELLPKINEISNAFTKNFNDDLKAILDSFDKFEEDYQNGRNRAREKAPRDKTLMTTLQNINEDEDGESNTPDNKPKRRSSNKSNATKQSSTEDDKSNNNAMENIVEKPKRVSKKRSKDEVEGMSSPEQADKRMKRSASVKAQSIISKQVNVNLLQKLRRDEPTEKRKGRGKTNIDDDDKENTEPSVIQIKQEKESMLPEPLDQESLPLNVDVKREENKDDIAMPPPMAPVPKSRRAPKDSQPNKSDDNSEEETSTRRRTTRTKKQTDVQPAGNRATRASSRASSKQQDEETIPPPSEARPKRTRGKKKVSDVATSSETINDTQSTTENVMASPADKPRPKRTRKAQKAVEQLQPVEEPQKPIEIKQERISVPEISSPILTKPKNNLKKDATKSKIAQNLDQNDSNDKEHSNLNHNTNDSKAITINSTVESALDETRVISKDNNMDKTMVLPNGVYNHEATSPKDIRSMNETVVIEKQQNIVMDSTVVLDKECKAANITSDNSMLTDDNDEPKTPTKEVPVVQPTSAVKEKVQQFEELASRVTRTKTRAMAKLAEQEEQTETHTPPDKISKAILSADTLTKMNSLIFNGKTTHSQVTSSASKPQSQIPTRSNLSASTSKLSSMNKHKENAEESILNREMDARKKKEAMLEAKRELQKRKREEKMAAAAAARLAAEQGRVAAALAAEKERSEKLAMLDQAKMERKRDLERKKQELARKVAETEERRRQEEQARAQRLAIEQKRAVENRKKQIEEQEHMKKEAAIMAKEIEMKQKEYIEKQKAKRREESKGHTPLKSYGTPLAMQPPLDPVYMQDGFQYLNSDEEEEPADRVPPTWSMAKYRKQQLIIQSQVPPRHIDRLFSVRVHSPDLRELFPLIERSRLKRTSSAVWRTPPRLPTLLE